MAWDNQHRAKRKRHLTPPPNHGCNNCGTTGGKLELDHSVPLAFGGSNNTTNLQWLCIPCHRAKTRAERITAQKKWAARGNYPPEPHPGMLK